MEKIEITQRINYLEYKGDKLKELEKNFYRDEQEEEDEIFRSLSSIEEMQENCATDDYELHSLLEEKKYILNKIRVDKSVFVEEFNIRMRQEKDSVEREQEELRHQLKELQEQDNKQTERYEK